MVSSDLPSKDEPTEGITVKLPVFKADERAVYKFDFRRT
jgi:hypothetical protein